MNKIKITGGCLLTGNIPISGAKNSVVALIPAALLCDEEVIIDNVPDITDVSALEEILNFLGSQVIRKDNTIIINNANMANKDIPENIAKKLRASYYFMGSLLGRYHRVKMYFPGGCPIGKRPINLHLMSFEKLGATVESNNNQFIIDAPNLHGNTIHFETISVGATINAMLASVKASGTTVIHNAALEPEVVNVAEFLNKMGADISGIGTSTLTIKGVNYLHKAEHTVIPDRIEAGTYIIIGALLGQNLTISNIEPIHLKALLDKLTEVGCDYKIVDNKIFINRCQNLKSSDIITKEYPGFPTDLQQPFTTLLTQCQGNSTVDETIYENRFLNVEYLNNMGATIALNNRQITISGPTKLIAQTVTATDLRAGASLIIAALLAEGTTTILDSDHILRGYDKIIDKLKNVGAIIEKIDD